MDNASYQRCYFVRDLATALGIELLFLPPYSPNLNLIERLWKFLKKHALSDWHTSFEAMQQAVANVLDHLDKHTDELKSLLSENFQLWPDEAWQACPTE